MTVIKTKKDATTTPKKDEKFVLLCLNDCDDRQRDRYEGYSFNTEKEAVCKLMAEDPEETHRGIICKVVAEYSKVEGFKEAKRYE